MGRRKRGGRHYVSPTRDSSLLPQVPTAHPSTVPFPLHGTSPSMLRGLPSVKQEPSATHSSFALGAGASASSAFPQPSLPLQWSIPAASVHHVRSHSECTDNKLRSNRRKRRSSDEASASGTESHDEEEDGGEEQPKEEMRWIAQSDLDKWKQKMSFQVEDYFANEQLKRIAEFGRVHANLLQEAKQYVYNVEMQLKAQFEQERAALRVQAEEFVAKVATENEALRQQVAGLEQQIDGLKKQVDVLQSEKTQHGRQEPDSPQEEENQPQQQSMDQIVCEPETNQDMGEDGPAPQQVEEQESRLEQQQPMDQSVCEAEANEDGENRPSNIDDGHEESQDAEPGARGTSTRPSPTSQQTNGHILKVKTPIPMLHAASSPPKDPQPKQPAHSNSDGAISSTSQESSQSLESSEPPAGGVD